MREHQRYFAIYDGQGNLLPHFVAVNNTLTRDESVVRRGHERVLRARLADSVFFFREDRKKPLVDRLGALKDVIYQAELGTSHAKVERFTELADYLAGVVAPEAREKVLLAARLAKCDLVTEVVSEFPSLQGIMGSEYARMDGYDRDVCLAIHEHYLPSRAGGELPSSVLGAVVGLADRMDTMVGYFAIGMEPTGSADPSHSGAMPLPSFALWRLPGGSCPCLFRGTGHFGACGTPLLRPGGDLRQGDGFSSGTLQADDAAEGVDSDLLEAVLSVGFDRVHELRARIDGLARFVRESEDFESLSITFKRIRNILKKREESVEIDSSLFSHPCEGELMDAYETASGEVARRLGERDYFGAAVALGELRRPVDGFFEGVEIMTGDDALRNNRLGVLYALESLFLRVADLSRFAV